MIFFVPIETTTFRLPTTIGSLRYLFGLWNLCCVIINCFFTTTLMSNLSKPGLSEQIETLDDLIESELPLRVDT